MRDDLLLVICDQLQQLTMKVLPIGTFKDALHRSQVIGNTARQHLRTLAIDGEPSFGGLESQPRNPWYELPDDKFEVFRIAARLNIPRHQQLHHDGFRYPCEAAMVEQTKINITTPYEP